MLTGDPYKVLGLKAGASPDEIRSAYRRLVKKYHPDRNPSASAATQWKNWIMAPRYCHLRRPAIYGALDRFFLT